MGWIEVGLDWIGLDGTGMGWVQELGWGLGLGVAIGVGLGCGMGLAGLGGGVAWRVVVVAMGRGWSGCVLRRC